MTLYRAQELANTPASSSKQAAQATPKGLLRLLCAGRSKLQNNRLFPLSSTLMVSVNMPVGITKKEILNFFRISFVGAEGVEPPTLCL